MKSNLTKDSNSTQFELKHIEHKHIREHKQF